MSQSATTLIDQSARPAPKAPRERGILFSAPMVRALLEGRKTQTRRALKPGLVEHIRFMGCEEDSRGGPDRENDAVIRYLDDEDCHSGPGWYVSCSEYPEEGSVFMRCPYGVPGDRLWVRETWAPSLDEHGAADPNTRYVKYRADSGEPSPSEELDWHTWPRSWRPSIFMPRWASRITLEITEVRVQRLRDISEDDARAEGFSSEKMPGVLIRDGKRLPAEMAFFEPRSWFCALWAAINGHESVKANPWVWALTFKRIT
jgi:hypothetical protein